jgi:hypothetical protein
MEFQYSQLINNFLIGLFLHYALCPFGKPVAIEAKKTLPVTESGSLDINSTKSMPPILILL